MFIWVAAFSLAAMCILSLLAIDVEEELQYSQSVATADHVNILFIGSSLTKSALPATEPTHGILGDGRSSDIRSVNDISERVSNTLLADAISSGAETVFLEINAYAHDYVQLLEPAFLGPYVMTLRETDVKLKFVLKRLLNSRWGSTTVWLDRNIADQTLDVEQLQSNDFYRLLKIEPSNPDELQTLLAGARDVNVEVFFFSPPRPQSAVSMMGEDEFAALQSHIGRIAAFFGVPLWSSPGAWPDDHFMNIHAHTNVQGRKRFQEELAQWYGARQ